MDQARQTRTIDTHLEEILIQIGIGIGVSLILRVLDRVGRHWAVRLSYPWALFQVKFLMRLNWGLLTFMVLYTSLQRSRLSSLAPIVGFYLRGIQRIIWTGFSPSIGMSLAYVSQHNHSREGKALTMAYRSAQALAQVFSTPETEQYWETVYSISQIFHITSTIVVQPAQVMAKPFSARGTGTLVIGRSWSLSLALRLVMMTKKLSPSGTVRQGIGNHTSPKASC
jgi:hypothetical protein